MKKKLSVGLIGDGHQVRETHLPYLERRAAEREDLEISWVGGCLCTPDEQQACSLREHHRIIPYDPKGYDWPGHFKTNPVDAVIVSNPNAFHSHVIRAALAEGVNVAVEKPTTIHSDECVELVALAKEKGLVFLTLSQRRYEDVYQKCKHLIEDKKLGRIFLINYLISHGFDKTPDGLDFNFRSWRFKKAISGGGALIDSAYHGIDTVLWLLKHCPEPELVNLDLIEPTGMHRAMHQAAR
jgi:predicted dehydrogenase